MAYVISAPCAGNKDASCTTVCPVDCIHPAPGEAGFEEAEQLFIDPEECIDCDACLDACPVDAVFSGHDLPGDQEGYRQKAIDFFALAS